MVRLVVVLVLIALGGCGGDGGRSNTGSVTVTASQTEAIAGGDVVTISATVKDQFGDPLVGQPVVFHWPEGYIFPPTAPGVTDENGTASIGVVSYPSGPVSVFPLKFSATSGSITSNSVTVTFRNPAETPASVTISASKPALISDGMDELFVTVTATDSNGLPLPGQAMEVTLSPSYSYTYTYETFTDRHGQGRIYFYSAHVPLNHLSAVTVTAKISGVAANPVTIAITPP